jgi:hypothetical protein
MAQQFHTPFSRTEAVALWSRLVAGWANSLTPEGSRTLYDGIPNYVDAGGSYEGVTRMLWGLGSWLAYPERPAQLEWRGVIYDVEQLTRRALVNGCDPKQLGTWCLAPDQHPDGGNRDQRTVESGQVAFAVWQTRDRIWSKMSETERNNVLNFLTQVGKRPSHWFSNWALFWVLNHAVRKVFGAPYEQAIIDEVMTTYMDGVYCGDGWYDDAATRGPNYFDNYITWVFASHVMAWAQMDGHTMPEQRDVLLERIKAWMQHYPYFFSADGAFVEYGRSLAYKFSRLGAPLWAYKLGLWPHSAGMLKRLVGKHLRWYVDRGAIRADGTLRQSLTATGSPEVMERYISTGATYWAMQAFGGLWSLRDDDPFWEAEEEPLPAEQGDFTKVYSIPGWVLTARDGHVQQFNAGVVKPSYGNKYTKLIYGTRNPFNVGLDAGHPSLDNCLCLSEDGVRGQREEILSYAVDEVGWLRSQYPIEVNGHKHMIDTTLIPHGDVHVRAHRITLDPTAEAVTAEEGSAPLGYDAGATPAIRRSDGWLWIGYAENTIGIKPLQGYTTTAQSTAGSPNSVYEHNLLAVLKATPLQRHHDLICVAYAGDTGRIAQLPNIGRMRWEPDGSFVAEIDGKSITVPALPV